jgi:hypothetical protein
MSPESATPAVVPRWEWRTFAPALAELRARVGSVAEVEPRRSDETYILGSRGTANAKLRAGVLDIKELQEVAPSGLELWLPTWKAKFPITADDVRAAFRVWKESPPALARERYTAEQFLAEVIGAVPSMRAVHVSKSRQGFTQGGCAAEFVRLTVDSAPLESFSLEHENPELILSALKALGLDSRRNMAYPAGLRRAIGLPA